MKKVKMYTYWKNGKIECSCPIQNKCRRERGCELIDFFYNEFDGIEECMKSRSYRRNERGAIEQR